MDFKKKIIIFVIIIVLLLLICFMFLNNKKISNKENYVEKTVVRNNIDDHLVEIYKTDPNYFERREESDVMDEPVESQNYVSDFGI